MHSQATVTCHAARRPILGLLALVLTCGILVAAPGAAHAEAGGGPVVLDGMDPVCHANMGEPTGDYIRAVLTGVHGHAGAERDGSIAVLGSAATSAQCGSTTLQDNMATWTAGISPTPQVTFHSTLAEVEAFFADVRAGTRKPSVIYIPDGGREAGVEDEFTANAKVFAYHVNAGGAVFSNMGQYGWLTALLPDAVYVNGGCNGGPAATSAGSTDFGLTDAIVTACWHGFFEGDLGGLVPLVDWNDPRGGDGRVAVAIGGASVTLPGGFEVSGDTAGPIEVGSTHTVTAALEDWDGNPVAGASVAFEVTSGPNAGKTAIADTDATGVAAFDLTSAVQGTDAITATVIVDGQQKTATYSVQWLRRPAAPVITGTVAGDTTLAVDVAPAAGDADAELSEIRVAVSPGDLVRTLPATGGSVTFTDLPNDTIHTVSAVATNAIGDGPAAETTAVYRTPRVKVTSASGFVGRIRQVPIALEHFDGATDLLAVVALPADSGTLTVDTTGLDLVLLDGYPGFSAQPAIGFSGSAADVKTALGSRLLWRPAVDGEVTLSASVSEHAPGAFYNPGNGHYYTIGESDTPTTWSQAKTAAQASALFGMTGYLATITDSSENDFVANYTSAADVWIGASDAAEEGVWRWVTGPESGTTFSTGNAALGNLATSTYASWAAGEPNDAGGEHHAVTNWRGSVGLWNDLPDNPDLDPVYRYLIEYGGQGPSGARSATGTATLTATVASPILVPAPEPQPEPAPEPAPVPAPKPAPAPAPPRGVERVAGRDRAATAARLSAETFDPGVPVVYVVTGGGFADGLAAGVVAGLQGGPVLLAGETLSAETLAELERLQPGRIVIVGQGGAVSPDVEETLRGYSDGPVSRVGGADRYATAAQLSASQFAAGVPVVYLATGEEFADSLSAGPVAAHMDGPILLVGPAGATPEVLDELERLQPGRVVVLGGTAAVPAEVVTDLQQRIAAPFARIGGADRYETSALIAAEAHGGTVDTVYLATGRNFADAMTAPTAVFRNNGVLLLTDPEQLPASTAAALERLSPRRIVVLGGTAAVSDAVQEAVLQYLR